jgi:hypothetical protein
VARGAIALACVAAVADCAPIASVSRPGTGGSPAPPPSGTPSGDLAMAPDAPALLLATPIGLAVAAPGRRDRMPVSLPPGLWQPSAAVGPHGAVLLISAATGSPGTVLEGVLTGTHVRTGWTVSLPPVVGPAPLAGCVAADGAATVIADRLVYLRAGRVAGMHEVPATAGRCQMTDAGAVAYLAEVDHAVAVWDPGTDATVITATRCDDLGLGGGLLACLNADHDDVAVGSLLAPVAGRAAFDPASAQHLPGPARQVVLSPDGQWIALVGVGTASATIYRLLASGGDGAVTAFALAPGEALLGFVEP